MNHSNQLTRREFLRRAAILGLSTSAVALLDGCGIFPAPTPTPARISKIGVIDFFDPASSVTKYLLEGLAALGYVEGRDFAIEIRYAKGKVEPLPMLASELAALKVDILIGLNTATSLAVKNATTTIPVVFSGVSDPVGIGLVTNLAHPGGSVTGLTTYSRDLIGKRLELLKQSIPSIARVAVVKYGTIATEVKETQDAAEQLGLQLQWLEWRSPEDFENEIVSAINGHAEALFGIGALVLQDQVRFLELAMKNRMPVFSKYRENVDVGALMCYGVNLADHFRRPAIYIDKILKGTKPGDLPVEGPTKFDLVINLKTAKQLGLTIPQSVLAQATEVIQ